MSKYKIAFVCVHNSCRSQMAEAIAKIKHSDFFVPESAGTMPKKAINPGAVTFIKEHYGHDMGQTQKPKKIDDIDNPDLLITMGCNVACPYISTSYRDDWGLDDPSGKSVQAYRNTAMIIEEKLENLRRRLEEGELKV